MRAGDAIFIPSGRIHAIGAGNVIIEVQQNSDTTYRVFDWNRLGLDGKPRALHVQESLESINFNDIEPSVATADGEVLASCPHFCVERWDLTEPRADEAGRFSVFTVLTGEVACGDMRFAPGEFFLVPATMAQREVRPLQEGSSVLRTTIPERV